VAARSGDAAQFRDANQNLAMVSRNPRGHTLGIVGFGRIGRRVAEKAHAALDMRVIYNDVVRLPADLERPSDATYHPRLDTLLAEADCIVVAAPFSGGAILNGPTFQKMKKGSRLINVARGKLVDEDALVAALKDGTLAAAGLDVHFDEPNVNKELIKMRNVELLSHNAGASLDSHIGFEALGMENIVSYYKTGKAITAVNAQAVNAKL
jgi:lactate dehydrogenase-like 2-hydroxyacid dehydrogenase